MIDMKNTAIVLFLMGLLAACKGDDAQGKGGGAGPQAVDVFVVQAQDFPNAITTNGTLLANEEIALRSEGPGRIVQLLIEEGKNVKAGQLLLQIDDAEFRANLQKLRTQLELAEKDVHRKKELFAIKGVSQEVLDDALTAVATLKADIALTESKIRNCKVLAPFSGRVGLRYVSPGAYLSVGDRIATLVQENPIKVEFQVPQKYAHQVAVGQKVQFKLGGNEYDAEVYAKEPSIDVNSRTLRVRAKANNADGKLLPGSFVDLTLNFEVLEGALLVPTEVIVPQLRGEKIFLMKQGLAQSVEIKTGLRTETHVQILSGLNSGDTIITTALLALKDGAPIQPRKISKATDKL